MCRSIPIHCCCFIIKSIHLKVPWGRGGDVRKGLSQSTSVMEWSITVYGDIHLLFSELQYSETGIICYFFCTIISQQVVHICCEIKSAIQVRELSVDWFCFSISLLSDDAEKFLYKNVTSDADNTIAAASLKDVNNQSWVGLLLCCP